MRARYPDSEGFVERDGVKVAYEVFGSGDPALVFAPTDPLVHSRAWKAKRNYRFSGYVSGFEPGAFADRDALAHAIAAEIGRPVSYRPVETDGAERAAALLAELI